MQACKASESATPTTVPAKAGSYQAFLARLQLPEAAGLLRAMKLFVRNALANAKRLSVDELAEATRAFFEQMEEAIAQHPQWAGCGQADLEKANDGVEKYVMTKLYSHVFAATDEEVAEDEQLTTWLQRLRFLHVEHLAISPEFCAMQPWQSAQLELAKISTYRTPRDKLVCILNCCKRINRDLSLASAGGHGADEFFPVLIFVALHAAPAGLHASLQYISRFRHPSKLVSEAAYYLTHMQSVVSFLTSVTPEQLSITKEEFERGLAETHVALEQERAAEVTAAAAAAVLEAEAAAEAAMAAAEAAAVEAATATEHLQSETADAEGIGQVPESLPALGTPPAARRRAQSFNSVDSPLLEVSHATAPDTLPNTPQPATPMLDPSTPPAASVGAVVRSTGVAAGRAMRRPPEPLRRVPVGVDAQLSVAGPHAFRLDLFLGSRGAVRQRQAVRRFGAPPSLRFLETRSVVELTMGEVGDLLQEYQWLSRALRHT
jgi:hypothetical protein